MKGSNNEVEIYPGTHHGFAFPKRPVYHRDAAERHLGSGCWRLYRRNLVPYMHVDTAIEKNKKEKTGKSERDTKTAFAILPPHTLDSSCLHGGC